MRNDIADARDLQWAIHRALDRATVEILALTSSPNAVVRVAFEERTGVSPYDDAPTMQPRDLIKACRQCGARFVDTTFGQRLYCHANCGSKHFYYANAAYRARRAAATTVNRRARKERIAS